MISYEFVPGFFVQDVADSPDIFPRFGLIDTSNDRWLKFEAKIRQLNEDSPIGTTYKFFLLTRHGQGYHNLGEPKYGTHRWDHHWSKLNGDGVLTWGPDPLLTPLGIEQARALQDMWKTESSHGLAPPQKLYCSPLTRALRTCEIMLDGVFQSGHAPVTILENCREGYGMFTSDKRKTRTYIATSFPHFIIEDGFSELDELWEPTVRETEKQVAERARKVLDVVFLNDIDAQFISITSHGKFINGFLRAIGRSYFHIPTGGCMPVVVKSQTPIQSHSS